jgi:hypothetical protein
MVELSKRKTQQVISSFFVLLYFCSLPAQAQYGGGTGEPNDPYLIYTAEQQNKIGLHEEGWDKHFKLMADIDLSIYTGTEFNIIGDSNIPFTGVFYGNGHTISNFNYTSTQKGHTGLFGFIDDPNAQNRDLGLINPEINAGTGDYVGSLVRRIANGTITDCYVEGSSVFGGFTLDGLVGSKGGIAMIQCYSTAVVSGSDYVGGLAGSSGSVTQCFWDIQTSGRNLDIKILLSKRRYSFGIVNSRYYDQAITAITLKWCFSRRIFR